MNANNSPNNYKVQNPLQVLLYHNEVKLQFIQYLEDNNSLIIFNE